MSKYNSTKIPDNADYLSEPKRCHACESKNLRQEVLDSIDHTVCEYVSFCKDCNEYLGWFSYGNWEY